jgi:hypothetical protein
MQYLCAGGGLVDRLPVRGLVSRTFLCVKAVQEI